MWDSGKDFTCRCGEGGISLVLCCGEGVRLGGVGGRYSRGGGGALYSSLTPKYFVGMILMNDGNIDFGRYGFFHLGCVGWMVGFER